MDPSVATESSENNKNREQGAAKISDDFPLVAENEVPILSEKEAAIIIEKEDTMIIDKEDTMIIEKENPMIIEKEDPMMIEKEDTMMIEKEDTMIVEKEDTMIIEKEAPLISESDAPKISESDAPKVSESDAPKISEAEDLTMNKNVATTVSESEVEGLKKESATNLHTEKTPVSTKSNSGDDLEIIGDEKDEPLGLKSEAVITIESEDELEINEGNSCYEDVEPVPDGILSKEMIEEEKKIEIEIAAEDAAMMENERKEADKEQSFKRLLELLSRSKLYSDFLKTRMEDQKAKELRSAQLAEKKLSKLKLKENVKSASRNSRGASKSSKKRGRRKTSPESQKRRKLEEINLNDDLGYEDADEYAPDIDSDKLNVSSEEISERQPDLLTGGIMRDYQLDGYEWLKVLYETAINGILADEMGLGKTIQCIALLAHLIGKDVSGPFLICAPLSTLPNWLSEFNRFTPTIPVVLYHGHRDTRSELYKKISKGFKVNGRKVAPVVLTSYDIAIIDAKVLQKFTWRYIIVDEGHRLKNYNCRLVRELKRYTSLNRLLLTGTPLQNNLSELWSLLNFLLPEIFDNLNVFESWFDVTAMTDEGNNDDIIVQENERRIISTLHEILNPFLLRRTKGDVEIQLPPKKELMVYAPLTGKQGELYKAILDKSILAMIKEKESKGSEVNFDNNGKCVRTCAKNVDYSVFERDLTKEELDIIDAEWEAKPIVDIKAKAEPIVYKAAQYRLNLRNLMMPLRKVCNHPYLLEYPLDQQTGEYRIDDDLVSCSGKLQVLDVMLPVLRDRGHKVLLFSQMTSLLDIIEDFCFHRQYTFVRLDGKTKFEERGNIIKDFNSDPEIFIFLLSTRAGGLGINLTAADTVIIYDSDWNPQCDLQAQDRCHRFGQTKPVVVYRLVTASTIDEKIVIRAAAKRKLEKMIMKKGRFSKQLDQRDNNKLFNAEELKQLLESKDHAGVVRTDNSELFTPHQLEMLLDRSDLLGRKDQGVSPLLEEQGVFKLLESSEESLLKCEAS